MTDPTAQQNESETRELRRLIRDLVALATTPAGWVGREPTQIADGVADILLHTLRAQAVYVALHSSAVQGIRASGYPRFETAVGQWKSHRASSTLVVDTLSAADWQTELRTVVCPIGLSEEEGFVAIGCSRKSFPTESESLLLSVAANQAAVAVKAARLRSNADLERRRFQSLLTQAPAAIGVMMGPDHRWAYVNDYYVRVTGRESASDLVGKTIRESLPEIESQPFIELLDEVYRTGTPYRGQEMKVTLNRAHSGLSREAYFDFVYEPVRNAEGSIDGVLVHAVDITEKVLAREKIRQSEEQFRAIVETTPDCVKIVAADGTLLHMNRAGLTMVGASAAEEVVGKSIYNVIAPEDRDRFRELNERICRGERGTLEFDMVRPDGSRRHMETHAVPLQIQNEPTAHLAVTLDLTDRKLAAQALRESEQRFDIATEASPIMVWMSGTDKLCFYFNKGWLDFVGRPLAKEIGNGWAENVHPDDFGRCFQEYVSRFEQRQPFEMEYRLRHHSGQYRWILDRGVPRFTPEGVFEGYIGGCLDIHAQKEASEYKHSLAAIVQSSDDGIISKNLNGIITSWNPAAERIFGFKAEEMIGVPVLKIIPPELHPDEARILDTIARGEKIEHFETVRLKKTGERIDVSLTISPVRDESGRIVGAAKIARDITAQKKTEQALRVTERLASVGRLAATVAHEINNPLEAVTNYLYIAKDRAVREDVREFLSIAEEELDRVSHMTKQTLGFYRDTNLPSLVEIDKVIAPLISVFTSRAKNKGVQLRSEIQSDLKIQAIGGEIRQVIANLLANSIDAAPLGGQVRIRVRACSNQNGANVSGIRITVGDTGAGIPCEIRNKLFEPFFTTKKDVGTGLGLWVCKSIVDKHHGSIRLKSSTASSTSGTVFSVFLPALASAVDHDALSRAV